jgi:hypothetical protein
MDVLEKARDLLKVSAAIKFSLFDGETGKVEPIEWPKVQPNKRLLQPIAEPLNRECERQMRYLSNLASHLQSKVERLKRQSARSRPSVDADGGVKEHTRLEKSVKSQSTPIENEGVPLMGERGTASFETVFRIKALLLPWRMSNELQIDQYRCIVSFFR